MHARALVQLELRHPPRMQCILSYREASIQEEDFLLLRQASRGKVPEVQSRIMEQGKWTTSNKMDTWEVDLEITRALKPAWHWPGLEKAIPLGKVLPTTAGLAIPLSIMVLKANVYRILLYHGHCAKHSTKHILCFLLDNSKLWIYFFYLFYRRENWSREKLSTLPKITQISY